MTNSLATAKYLIALSENTVTDGIRNDVINEESVSNILLKNMLYIVAKKVKSGNKADDAIAYLMNEYEKLDFYNMYQIDKDEFEILIKVCFRGITEDLEVSERLDILMEVLPAFNDLTINTMVSISVLDYLVGLNKIGTNIEYTKALINKIQDIDTETLPGFVYIRELVSIFTGALKNFG
jgi:hypothetical protein